MIAKQFTNNILYILLTLHLVCIFFSSMPILIIRFIIYRFYIDENIKDCKHNELPKERRLPWLALNEVSLLMFLDIHACIKNSVM